MKTLAAQPIVVALLATLAGATHVCAQDVQPVNDAWQEYHSAKVTEASPCDCGGSSACGYDAHDQFVWDRSLWTVTADAVFLERRDPAPVVWAFNTANPTQDFDAADFEFGFQTGLDVSVARRLGCDNAIEFRYFGVDDWSATSVATTTPGDLLQVNAARMTLRKESVWAVSRESFTF